MSDALRRAVAAETLASLPIKEWMIQHAGSSAATSFVDGMDWFAAIEPVHDMGAEHYPMTEELAPDQLEKPCE